MPEMLSQQSTVSISTFNGSLLSCNKPTVSGILKYFTTYTTTYQFQKQYTNLANNAYYVATQFPSLDYSHGWIPLF